METMLINPLLHDLGFVPLQLLQQCRVGIRNQNHGAVLPSYESLGDSVVEEISQLVVVATDVEEPTRFMM